MINSNITSATKTFFQPSLYLSRSRTSYVMSLIDKISLIAKQSNVYSAGMPGFVITSKSPL